LLCIPDAELAGCQFPERTIHHDHGHLPVRAVANHRRR
jgi:hypothetical protein